MPAIQHPCAATPCRCYGAEYRISVKREDHGVVSRWLHDNIRAGSVLDVAAPRGEFYLTDGTGARLSCCPRASASRRCWRCCTRWPMPAAGARSGGCTPPVMRRPKPSHEVSDLIAALPHARQQVFYTSVRRPAGRPRDRGAGSASRCATVYMCGPDPFMADMRSALTDAGIDPAHITPSCSAPCLRSIPASSTNRRRGRIRPRVPQARGRPVSFSRSGSRSTGRRSTPASWSSRRPATCQRGSRAEAASATCVTQVIAGNDGLHPTSVGAAARRDCVDLHRRAARRSRILDL